MCGIVGAIGPRQTEFCIEGLKRLSYRGFDSYGLIAHHKNNYEQIFQFRSLNNPKDFKHNLKEEYSCALGHNRWCVFGENNIENCHPHKSNNGKINLVHNGIIENYQEIKDFLSERGYGFYSETDTEVLTNYIEYMLYDLTWEEYYPPILGTNVYVWTVTDAPNTIYIRNSGNGSILVSPDGYLASDIIAFKGFTDRCYRLQSDEMATLTVDKFEFDNIKFFRSNKSSEINITSEIEIPDKKGNEYMMLKEIKDQIDLIKNYEIANFPIRWIRARLIGCGSSYYSGLFAEKLCSERGLISTEYASEVLYKKYHKGFSPTKNIFISQSGETKDIIDSISWLNEKTYKFNYDEFLGLTNNSSSKLSEVCDQSLDIGCGAEFAVAATKSFTLSCLRLIELLNPSLLDEVDWERFSKDIADVIECCSREWNVFCDHESGEFIYDFDRYLILGSGLNYPIALESALKIKEVAQKHAEGMPAAELKHGPLALVDEHTLSIFLVSDQGDLQKIRGNLEEISARGGKTLLISTESDYNRLGINCDAIFVPECEKLYQQSLLMNIVLQMFSYCLAVENGINPDFPRSLAKSVTV